MIETSGHLPECRGTIPVGANYITYCICPALRACEARVKGEDWQDGYTTGHDRGVQAARDAVAALPCPITFCGLKIGDHAQSHLLAAIDALRGES